MYVKIPLTLRHRKDAAAMMNAMTAYTAAYAQDACAAFVRPSSADNSPIVISLDVSLLASISIIILLALLVLVLLRHAYQRTTFPPLRPALQA